MFLVSENQWLPYSFLEDDVFEMFLPSQVRVALCGREIYIYLLTVPKIFFTLDVLVSDLVRHKAAN